MDILAELQKRGFQVVQCPGRIQIIANRSLLVKAQQDGVTFRDQVNEAITDYVEDYIAECLADDLEREGDDPE